MAVSKTRRALGAGAAFVGVGAAGLLMAAPANAAVTGIEITTPSGYGSVADRYGSNCEYDVEASVDNASASIPVAFTVTPEGGTASSLGSEVPTGDTASTSWTPGAPGVYEITATQVISEDDPTTPNVDEYEESSDSMTATVGTGITAPDFSFLNGSLQVDLPWAGACIVVLP
ncbi:hypothetical protein VZC37_19725 [Gordonia sp. LSe1-13]|uniref:Uncharacterized protein n=1 Tax=Gordonia sesuvii TaxID=3116777 RepID=A0ABU7MHJ9_9ACTN|nr:hypothetical protein [Gordonia sp. LSe1-13]